MKKSATFKAHFEIEKSDTKYKQLEQLLSLNYMVSPLIDIPGLKSSRLPADLSQFN